MEIALVVAAAIGLYVVVSVHRRRSAVRAAKTILEQSRKLYQGRHEYREVTLADVPGLDTAFYERVSGQLRDRGYQHLGDVEDLTSSASHPEMRTVIRIFTSPERETAVAVYHVRVRGPLGVLLWLLRKHSVKIVEAESYLEDGVVLVTNDTSLAAAMQQPPEIRLEHLPAGTPVANLLERHSARLAEHLDSHGGRTRRISTLPDVLREQERIEELKAAFRGQLGGGVTPDEIRAIGGEPLGGEVADRLEELSGSESSEP